MDDEMRPRTTCAVAMKAMDIADGDDHVVRRSGQGACNPHMLGRKSVLMGILASGFVLTNVRPPDATAGTIKPIAATQPPYALRWAPSTTYARGQQVISPNNDVVSSNVAHTSSAAFTTDKAKWALSSTYAGVLRATLGVLYVSSTDGDDTNDGLSFGRAFRSIQAAIDSVASSGYAPRHIIVAPGTYAPFTHAGAMLTVEGLGTIGSDENTGCGNVVIAVPTGQYGASLGVGAASEIFQGATLRNLYFTGVAGSLGGVRMGRQSNFLLDRVGCANFPNGPGFFIEGDAASQYGTMRDCQAFDCLIGVDVAEHNGLRIFGGTIEYLGGPVAAPVGSFGIRAAAGADTLRVTGSVIQFVETGIDVSGEGSVITAPRLEATATGIVLRGVGGQIYGGTVNNFISGGAGVGIQVATTATRTDIFGTYLTAVTTKIQNLAPAGQTAIYTEREIDAKLVRFTDGAYITQGSTTGAVAVGDKFEVPHTVTTGTDDYAAGIYLGGIQDTHLHRLAAGVAGGVVFRPNAFTTAGRPSAASVGAGSTIYDTTLRILVTSDGTAWRNQAGVVV